MLGWYRLQLARRPFATQCITTAFLFGTGDVMAQQLVEKNGLDKHNLARTARMVGYGGLVFGPAATQWYKILQKINLSNRTATIAARVLTDQVVFASCNLGLFLSTMAYLEGADVKQRLNDKYIEALKKNWMVWPPVQSINFGFVPLQHQVLVVNVVSLGWNCYLSYVNSSATKKDDADDEKAKSLP